MPALVRSGSAPALCGGRAHVSMPFLGVQDDSVTRWLSRDRFAETSSTAHDVTLWRPYLHHAFPAGTRPTSGEPHDDPTAEHP